jgi:tRNA threonylcarbamoyladenosine biosynthesis protein TsaB
MNVILFIDTAKTEETRVALEINGKRFEKISTSRTLKSQTTLPLIETLLADHHLQFSDISEIQVNSGPGSFTGIRVGLSIANTLSMLLHIPVNGKQTLALPHY